MPVGASRLQPSDPSRQEPEKDLWTGRTNWKHFLGRILLLILINIAIATLLLWVAGTSESFARGTAWRWILAVIALTAVVGGGPILWRILSLRYRLTTERLFIERGILSQTIDQTELIRVDDVRLEKSLTDRLLGLGSIALVSTDSTDNKVRMDGIRDPEAVSESIRDRMRALRRRSLFVEGL